MPTTGNRGLKFKYSSGIAPLVTQEAYKNLIANYKKIGAQAFPHILNLGGMAIDTSQNRNKWRVPLSDLHEVAAQLKGAPLMKDHDIDHVDSIVGKVEDAWVEEDGEGGGKVVWKGECSDESLIQKILLGYVKNNSIQIAVPQAYCDNCITKLGRKEEEATLDNLELPCPRCGSLEMVARHPGVLEQSLVAIPAYANAEITPFGFKASLDDLQEKRIANAKKLEASKKVSLPDLTPLVAEIFDKITDLRVGVIEMETEVLRAGLDAEPCEMCGGRGIKPGSTDPCMFCGGSGQKKGEEIGRQSRVSPGQQRALERFGGEGAPESELQSFPLVEKKRHEGTDIDETDEDEKPKCPECGGPLEELGHLGSRMYSKCRNCGAVI